MMGRYVKTVCLTAYSQGTSSRASLIFCNHVPDVVENVDIYLSKLVFFALSTWWNDRKGHDNLAKVMITWCFKVLYTLTVTNRVGHFWLQFESNIHKIIFRQCHGIEAILQVYIQNFQKLSFILCTCKCTR